jgi:hypothetical protein
MDELCGILNDIQDYPSRQKLILEFRIDANFIPTVDIPSITDLNDAIIEARNRIRDLPHQGNGIQCEVNGPYRVGNDLKFSFLINVE